VEYFIYHPDACSGIDILGRLYGFKADQERGVPQMIYLELIWGFLKVGFFSFGGGYAAIPLIRDVVLEYGWLTDDMLSNMIAISESTPGPVMLNLATYVGYSQGGFLGALIATLLVVLPSFIIILLVMSLLRKVIEDQYVKAVLKGLQACILGVILATGMFFALRNCIHYEDGISFDVRAIILTAVLSLIYFGAKRIRKNGLSPILLILISAFLGIIAYAI
jgi:chromate transporter